ncbi:MAG: hypothetical protein ABIS86_12075 [Streptosporangiaceae bacterium]
MGIDLPLGAELAYSGFWTQALQHQTIFRELALTRVTDETLRQVGEMPWLRVLHLAGDFTDTAPLRGLTGLATLGVDSSRLESLVLPDAPLTVLSLTADRLPDSALTGLPGTVRLLFLRLPRLDPAFLATLTQVETIIFAGTPPEESLARLLAALAPTLTRVEFLGVGALDPRSLSILDAAAIKVGR